MTAINLGSPAAPLPVQRRSRHACVSGDRLAIAAVALLLGFFVLLPLVSIVYEALQPAGRPPRRRSPIRMRSAAIGLTALTRRR